MILSVRRMPTVDTTCFEQNSLLIVYDIRIRDYYFFFVIKQVQT